MNIEIKKEDGKFIAFFQDSPELIGEGSNDKEAIGDLIYKHAYKTGKVTKTVGKEVNRDPS